jgi:YgiT-type zinc finger domain-containing protein
MRVSKTTSKTNSYEVCRNCGAQAARQVKRDELYGWGKSAVIIEDVPMVQCDNCGMTYLEPQVILMIDEICAHPEKYAAQEFRPVAKIA